MRRVATVMALASIAAVGLFAATAQAHQGICTETTNPHGQNVPPAGSTTLPGPNGGQNEDGFYLISSNTGVDVFVKDLGRTNLLTLRGATRPEHCIAEKEVLEDEKLLGTVHVAFGASAAIDRVQLAV